VWLLAAGEEKAAAVSAALGGASNLPAAAVRGTAATKWLLDQAAASSL
jgi:6-phosphogluconolactonase